MSTSVIHPGTTRSAGPSGRFVGLAAAGLAAVIALGFVFASNQTNEVIESDVDLQVSQAYENAWNSRIEFMTQQHAVRQTSPASKLLQVNIDGDAYAARIAAAQLNVLPSDYRKLMDSVEAPIGADQHNAFPSDWRKLMDSVDAPIGADTAADAAPNRLPAEKRPR
ncbi:MAG: hypothetical protein WD895_02120 [Acidimicrobiia bacterium]